MFSSIKIDNETSKNILILGYRPPSGDSTLFEKHAKYVFSKNDIENRQLY